MTDESSEQEPKTYDGPERRQHPHASDIYKWMHGVDRRLQKGQERMDDIQRVAKTNSEQISFILQNQVRFNDKMESMLEAWDTATATVKFAHFVSNVVIKISAVIGAIYAGWVWAADYMVDIWHKIK